MKPGPETDQTSSRDPQQFYYRHTFASKLIGGASGALLEQGVFHPVDTAAKTAMASKSKALPWLRALIAKEGITGALKQLYGGFTIATVKKGPMRLYKYGVQDGLNSELSKQYLEAAQAIFGAYGHVVIQAGAGAITGFVEPFVFQPFDTTQVRKQVLKESISLENAKKLGVRNLYRATLVTGLGRNVPGSIGLFGGSELANFFMDNQDHQSNVKNIVAKTGGAFLSLGFSQPGDVIKTDMQTKLISFFEAYKGVTLKQLFSSGLTTRLALAGKVGFGFFVIEKGMNLAKERFGERVEISEQPTDYSKFFPTDTDRSLEELSLENKSPTLLHAYKPDSSPESSSESRLVENDVSVADLTKALKKSKI